MDEQDGQDKVSSLESWENFSGIFRLQMSLTGRCGHSRQSATITHATDADHTTLIGAGGDWRTRLAGRSARRAVVAQALA